MYGCRETLLLRSPPAALGVFTRSHLRRLGWSGRMGDWTGDLAVPVSSRPTERRQAPAGSLGVPPQDPVCGTGAACRACRGMVGFLCLHGRDVQLDVEVPCGHSLGRGEAEGVAVDSRAGAG